MDLFKYGFVSFDVLNDVGVFFLDVWVGYIYGFVFVVKLGVLWIWKERNYISLCSIVRGIVWILVLLNFDDWFGLI